MQLEQSHDGGDRGLPGVGMRLRAARKQKGLSGRELAHRAAVTPAYLSRLETGQLSPTVSTLSRIMQALDEPVASLFEEQNASGPLVRREDRRKVRSHGVTDELLSPSRTGRLEVLETTVDAGGSSGDAAYSHAGDEECVVVLEGSLAIQVGEERYKLAEGDALTFPCRSPHRWSNDGPLLVRALWIITPPGY